ncbi:MAG: amidohydrolase family protein [Anaerolineae bacterium]|nr:amidohydrolase family protein [Anaerolineae bacterium]
MIKRLIDSHIHFWQPDHLRYQWLASVPAINRPYEPADLARAAEGFPLVSIVFVQADCVAADGLGEVAWVSELAQAEPRIQGIVAFAPLEQGETAVNYLSQLRQYPLVKGVRRLLQDEPTAFATKPHFVRGVQALADFDLSFDICIRHHQLEAAIALVKQCPQVRFVLDHFGKPDIKAHLMEPWATNLAQLAALPNVCCKLSGLVTEADWQHWTAADLQPYIAHALAVFGPERLLFGGDWPVCELAADYGRWVQTAVTTLNHLNEAEMGRIFYENARAFYRLSL